MKAYKERIKKASDALKNSEYILIGAGAGLSNAGGSCNCLLGNDIGVYNTCGHDCVYCYANYDQKTVIDNMKLHNPKSPFLFRADQIIPFTDECENA